MLVRLLVTGTLEKLAMSTFLAKAFSGVTFETDQVESFTSSRVHKSPDHSTTPSLVEKLADALIAAVDPGRKKPRGGVPDLVVAMDDVELCNLDQPHVIIDAVRTAIRRRVPYFWTALDRQNRCFDLLQQRASFHLLCPMIEAYFFTCDTALQAAKPRLTPKLVSGQDVEDFQTDDESYLLRFQSLPAAIDDGIISRQSQKWFAKHPKEYLKYLVSEGNTTGVTYRETKQGTEALKSLQPANALSAFTQRRFLRSLISDLADGLNMTPTVELVGDCHPLTSAYSKQDRLLRNI